VIFGCPARDAADCVALQSLEKLLDHSRWRMTIIAPETLTAELLDLTARDEPALVCIASLAPGGLAHTRYLCKRLSRRFPSLRIVVGRWGEEAGETRRTDFDDAGACSMALSLLETRQKLEALAPLLESSRTDGSAPDQPAPATTAAPVSSRKSRQRAAAAKDLSHKTTAL
jgi:hypothetical protein